MTKKNKNKYIVFGEPKIEKEDILEVISTLKSGWIGTGPKAKKFELLFSQYKNIKYSLSLNSCTAALHLALLSLNLKPGDEINFLLLRLGG